MIITPLAADLAHLRQHELLAAADHRRRAAASHGGDLLPAGLAATLRNQRAQAVLAVLLVLAALVLLGADSALAGRHLYG